MSRRKKIFCIFSIFQSKELEFLSRTSGCGKHLIRNTSERLLSNLPDFFHNSSDENVDKDNFDAPAIENSK